MTELSNLCGLAQVRAVKKSCHAALVFSQIETTLEGAQCQVKLLDWEPAQNVYLLWAFFTFSDEALKGARKRVPKPGPQNRQFCGDAQAYPHSIAAGGAKSCRLLSRALKPAKMFFLWFCLLVLECCSGNDP